MIKKINLQIILLFSFLLLPQFIVIADNNSLRSLEITNKTSGNVLFKISE